MKSVWRRFKYGPIAYVLSYIMATMIIYEPIVGLDFRFD